MKPDYLILTDGRKVRVEWNMNALCEFTSHTGTEMNELAGGKADIKKLRIIAWCSAVEGEAAEGRELGLSEIEFGRLMGMQSVIEFSKILAAQTSGAEKKNHPPLKFPKILFRKG